ncbi:MAG TPA: hypothetical protein VGD84_19925, partial [Pseudonocardiaceae bacterium]
DKQGPTQCVTGTGGAPGPSAAGRSGTGGGGGGTGAGGTGAAAAGGTGTAGSGAAGSAAAGGQQLVCDPSDPTCAAGIANTLGAPQINPIPTASDVSLGDGMQVALMVLAALLLLALGVGPPLIAQAMNRRRAQRGGAQ